MNEHPRLNDLPLEQQIAAALWRWKFAPPDQRAVVIAETQLALLLEYWIPYTDIPLMRSLNAWCDGVTQLFVSSPSRCTFLLAGVGYFPVDRAPFEVEYHFVRRRDTCPSSILLRWGIHQDLKLRNARHTKNRALAFLLQKDKEIADWAVAVQLTPDSE